MKKNTEKQTKVYTAGTMLKNFISIQILLLYLILMIGDFFMMAEIVNSSLIIRFIPIGLITLISSYLIFRSSIKKCRKEEEEAIKKNIFIGPAIVAVILLLYGFYSVKTNVGTVQEKTNKYSELYGNIYGDVYEELYGESFENSLSKAIEDAASEARKTWIITTVIFLCAGEVVAFIVNRKTKDWLMDDVGLEALNKNIITDEATVLNTSEGRQSENTALNNIKWDL